MPRLVLRLLLSVLLVLNGIGEAAAAASMELRHAMATSIANDADATHDGAAPCHDDGATATPADHDDDSGTPDCCRSGQCHCPCAQHVYAATTIEFDRAARLVHADVIVAPKAGHASPTLPHVMRPPIA
jgi:hypothetical protein